MHLSLVLFQVGHCGTWVAAASFYCGQILLLGSHHTSVALS